MQPIKLYPGRVSTRWFRRSVATLFEFGRDQALFRLRVEGDLQQVGAAANLAVFDVTLVAAGGFVDGGLVPLAASRTLEAGGHRGSLLVASRDLGCSIALSINFRLFSP